MSTAKGYHDALLALSGNPVFAAARDTLLASISDNELLDVITHGLKTGSPRETLNAIATRLLDGLARAPKVDDVVVPGKGKHGDDDGDDDHDSGGGGVRKSGGGGKPKVQEVKSKLNPNLKTITKTQKERRPIAVKRAQPQPAQTPASQGTPSSTANRKRPGPKLAQPAKKRKDVSPEPMDDEEDFFKTEGMEEQEEAKEIARKDTKKHPSNAPATNSNTTVSSSITKEIESQTDTSSEDDAMWKEIQNHSVIRDLQLVDRNNINDKEKNGDGKQADARVSASSLTKTIQIPDIEVRFKMPKLLHIPSDAHRGTMDVFPLSFVKEYVRNFNRNYLVGEKNRTAFRDMIKKTSEYGLCVRCDEYLEQCHWWRARALAPHYVWKHCCVDCLGKASLCARSDEWVDYNQVAGHGKIVLTVYPVRSDVFVGAGWRTIGFWVGTQDR